VITHLSLFSGIGGIDIAAEWAGFTTIAFVEIDPFCQKVLRKHWPDVPIIEDIRDVTKEKIMAYPKCDGWRPRRAELKGQDGQFTPLGTSTHNRKGGQSNFTVDLITGGFPCQPFSVAGKRKGKADERYLWPEMLRVIQELKPTWVCGENVAGIIHMGIDTVLSDLERAGYQCQVLVIPACSVNAPHRRDRCFILGYAERERIQGVRSSGQQEPQAYAGQGLSLCSGEDVADTEGWGRGRIQDQSSEERPRCSNELSGNGDRLYRGAEWWATESRLGGMVDGLSQWMDEPDIPRVATGVKDRVQRLKALGNAVVPAQIYPILKAIAETYKT